MKRQRESDNLTQDKKIVHIQYGSYKIVVHSDGFVEFIINPVDTQDESPNKMFKKSSDSFPKPELTYKDKTLNNSSDTLSDIDEDDMHQFLGTTSYHSTSSLMSIVHENRDRKFSIKVVDTA